MFHASNHFLVLLIFVSISFLAPMIAMKLRVPSAVMLIVLGGIIGQMSAGLISDGPIVTFLYDVGFIMLMFMAGLEIDFNSIRAWGRRLVLVLFLICCLVICLSFFVVCLFGFPAILGLALGAISVGLPLAIMKEMDLVRTSVGQFTVLLGSIGEFVTILSMTVFYFSSTSGFSVQLFIGTGKLMAVLLVSGVVLKILVTMAWWKPERFSRFSAVHDGSEMGIRASLVLMTSFTTLALLAGVEPIIGAFLAGAVLSFVVRGKHVVVAKLTAVSNGFFIPAFFIIVGARFDCALVSYATLVVTVKFSVLVFLVRFVPFILFKTYDFSIRDIMSIASILSTPLTLMIAIATIGSELGQLDSFYHTSIILLSIISTLIYPGIFRLLFNRGQERSETLYYRERHCVDYSLGAH